MMYVYIRSYLEVVTVNSVVPVYLRRYVCRKVTYVRTRESITKISKVYHYCCEQECLGVESGVGGR